jgi:hypothetical protein
MHACRTAACKNAFNGIKNAVRVTRIWVTVPLGGYTMGYIARVPATITELEESLKKIHENKSHVKSVHTNESTSHLEVDLDWAAHKFGGDAGKDFFIPIKRGRLREAKNIVDKMMQGDHAPSRTEAQSLYDLIDPQNK